MKEKTLKQKQIRTSVLLIMPLFLFTLFFILGPLIYLFILSFSKNGGVSGVVFEFTLGNYFKIADSIYRKIFIDSLTLGVLTTLIVALFGYPFGYFAARASDKWKKIINSVLMVPFWVSSLLRLYGWVIFFRSNGVLDKILIGLNVTTEPLKLLYTKNATLVGMIYALLPFMIFAVYSSAEKLDWTLIEASRDLGADKTKAFWTVAFPLTLPGLFSGVILTFVPSMGLIFIAEILGGNKVMLIGNLISEQATVAHNIPFAAALSIMLMIITLLLVALYQKAFNLKDLEGMV